MEERRIHHEPCATLSQHMTEHEEIQKAVAENHRVMQRIAADTAEIVEIFKGAKFLRNMLLYLAPVVGILYALYYWIKGH